MVPRLGAEGSQQNNLCDPPPLKMWDVRKEMGLTLQSLKVRNFQSIDEVEVQFGKFTVFTGPSSSGKSAFLRASKALARNTFTPSQVRQGSKESIVSMGLDGHTIQAIRGKSKSTYKLDDKEFTKAGRTVPEEIEEVLSLPMVGDLEVTFSTQFDKPFLISEPGSVGSKVLGELTNVGVLHSGVREANRRSLETRSRIKVKEQDLKECISSLEAFEDLDPLLESLRSLEKTLSNTEDMLSRLQSLNSLLSSYDTHQEELTRVQESISDLGPVETLMRDVVSGVGTLSEVHRVVASIQRKYEDLPKWGFKKVPDEGNLFTDIDLLASLHRLVEKIYWEKEALPIWDYSRVPDTMEDITQSVDSYVTINTIIESLKTKAELLKVSKVEAKRSKERVLELEEEYSQVLPDICPLCGSETRKHEH